MKKKIKEKVLKEVGKENNLDMMTCDCPDGSGKLCITCSWKRAIEKALTEYEKEILKIIKSIYVEQFENQRDLVKWLIKTIKEK